ncbi:unnamed protein product [Musa acuminata var. zebrina]
MHRHQKREVSTPVHFQRMELTKTRELFLLQIGHLKLIEEDATPGELFRLKPDVS